MSSQSYSVNFEKQWRRIEGRVFTAFFLSIHRVKRAQYINVLPLAVDIIF